MDVDISRCILDFLARPGGVDDGALKCAFKDLPLPGEDPVLAKLVVLRSIQCEIYEASISERLLECIEVVEEIDRNLGMPITEGMKEAYCAVAVECCVRYIHGSRLNKLGKFVDAVKRIWKVRIRAMERSSIKSKLLTPKLLRWGCQIEAALGDKSECLNLMMINTRADAFRAVEGYVTDAIEKMPPPFLDTIATRNGPGWYSTPRDEVRLANDEAGSAGPAGVSRQERSLLPGHGEEIGFTDHRAESDTRASQQEIGFAVDKAEPAGKADSQVGRLERSLPPGQAEEIGFADHRAESDTRASHQEKSDSLVHGDDVQIDLSEAPRRAKEPVEMHELRRSTRPPRYKRKAALRIVEDSTNEALRSEYDFIPSPDVNKVQAALRNSSSELQAAVEDPLPDALRLARSFGSNANVSVQEQTGKVVTKNNADSNAEVSPPVVEENCPKKVPNHHNDVREPTLMERKSSARTDEWDESLEDSIEDLTGDEERPMLSSRKRRAVSPLSMPQVRRYSLRRPKRKWTAEEEDALREGVKRFGRGNWKVISQNYADILIDRTEVDLKDKWRNMTR